MSPSSPRAWRTDPAQTIGRAPAPGAAPQRAWLGWLLALGLAAAWCTQRSVCEPRSGSALPLAAGDVGVGAAGTAGPVSLRLATLHLPETPNLPRIAAALEPASVAGLQSARGAAFGRANDAQILGERLSRGWLFAPATRWWGSEASGAGLLSRDPLAHWQTIPLPGDEPTQAVLAVAPLGGGSARVLVVQLTAQGDAHSQQLAAAIALFESLARPAALVGNLGVGADDPQLAALLAKPDVRDAVYAPLGVKPAGVDWIITRGLRTTAAGVGEAGTAEHPLLWAEVEPTP